MGKPKPLSATEEANLAMAQTTDPSVIEKPAPQPVTEWVDVSKLDWSTVSR